MRKNIYTLKLCICVLVIPIFNAINAQPTATPAANYVWVKTGTGTYSTGEISTSPGIPSDTSYGMAGDTDPSDCSSYCGGSCDGSPYIQDIVFGTTPGFSNSSCEQRSISFNQWNNTNPDSGVSSGATSGIVHVPTSAQLVIVQSPNPGSPGTGAGGDENRAWIIGGGGGNTEFKVNVNYSIDWYIPTFSLNGGSGNLNYNYTWNWGDPGNGTELETSGWNNYTTDGFGQSLGETFNIPVSDISQTGTSFMVDFVANSTIEITRNGGNADGKAQHGPGMEGRASFAVTYDIWEIQPILPVELSSFDASMMDNRHVKVQWETQTESNMQYYEVQKSTDAIHWKAIGQVKSKGNSTTTTSYSYIDYDINANSYYRLNQVDMDGSIKYSDAVFVERHNRSNITSIFPNPSNEFINLVGEGIVKSQIIDAAGRILLESRETVIDIQALANGLYYTKVFYQNDESEVLKLLKM